MADSKFFTNQISNTLFDKFKGIREGMTSRYSFHAAILNIVGKSPNPNIPDTDDQDDE